MAIPKMKIYRLDQNYSPDNDTDLKSISDDELYPFVEKSLDLGTFEELVGVTYRDLTVGRASTTEHTKEIAMLSDGGDALDGKKTEFVCCDGWKKGRGALKVQIKTDDDGSYSEQTVPENYYRTNFSFQDNLYDSTGSVTADVGQAVSRRRSEMLQIEFGDLIYADEQFLKDKTAGGVKVTYRTFTDDLSKEGTLALERGNIYDGTRTGRIGVYDASGYGYRADENGFPLKAEGNIGYKIRTYPCRQKVAQMTDVKDSAWHKDLEISQTGGIVIENCQNWILTQADERRPRLFERVTIGEDSFFRELEQNVQYTITNIPKDGGRIDVSIQLSSEYYNVEYGRFVFPKELFVRYNEEDDILDDLFVPDYLDYESPDYSRRKGDTGSLTSSLTAFDKVSKRIFKMAVAENAGYDPQRDFLLKVDGNGSASIDFSSVYGGEDFFKSVKLFLHGALIYGDGAVMESSPFAITAAEKTLTITPKETSDAALPSGILTSYLENHTVGLGKVREAEGDAETNHWCCGYRICCYEKTRIAKEFVSSFRNWVSDHLNNNPDIFLGFQKYEGSAQNPVAPSYIGTGFSILHREGAVVFSEPIAQADLNDVRNWPPADASADNSVAADALKIYLRKVYAKFAYYDGICDVSNGLLREFDVESGVFKYRMIDDPTYSAHAEDRRWLLRSDNKMPTTFFHQNTYLPAVNYVETGECTLWQEITLNEGETLKMNLSDYRALAVVPNGGTLLWNAAYAGETEKTTETTAASGDVKWRIKDGKLYENGSADGTDGTAVLEKLTDADYDAHRSVGENIEKRGRHTYSPGGTVPYDVVFEAGDSYLTVYARKTQG